MATVVSVGVDPSDATTAKVPSVLPAAVNPKDHFVTAKSQSSVILRATLSPGDDCDDISWEVDGAAATVPGDGTSACTVSIPRDQAGRFPVRIWSSGAVVWEGCVWVVWATVTGPAYPITIISRGGRCKLNNGQLSPCIQLSTRPTHVFRFAVIPPEIVDDTPGNDIPNLKGPNTIPPPTVTPGQTHIVNNGQLADGADRLWDVSRRMRIRIINPHLYRKDELPETSGRFLDGQPAADHTPEDYPLPPLYDAVGNDDTVATVAPGGNPIQSNDPYRSSPHGMWSHDQINITMPHQTGVDGHRFEVRYHFGEFARLQIGDQWYRVSDFFCWRVHFRFIKVYGAWRDGGSVIAWDNAGF